MAATSFWKDRLRASAIHFGMSLGIAALAALLVFGVWYPSPYREISGGRELFQLLVGVDVIIGPLITLLIFNRAKPWRELRMDLALVAVLQMAALGYGLWTVAVARPVHLVFEYHRFAVVHAIEVPPELLDKCPPGIRALPLSGPTLLSLRAFKSNQEKTDMTLQALNGVGLATRPDLWQPYDAARSEILREAKPVTKLKERFPAQTAQIDQAASAAGREADALVYLPMTGRNTFWTVLLDPATAYPLAFLPLDSY